MAAEPGSVVPRRGGVGVGDGASGEVGMHMPAIEVEVVGMREI